MKTFVAAKIIIQHPYLDQVLLVQRERSGVKLFEPCGGRLEIDFSKKYGENLEQCAQREAMEELGVGIYDLEYMGSYAFFWTKRDDVCSVCVLFLAKTEFSGDVHKVADAECFPAHPKWVSVDHLLSENAPIDPAPLGLKELMQKAALKVKNYTRIVPT
jgi:ADP-ribose pyrophosphatase YjhB (NUDIX family)